MAHLFDQPILSLSTRTFDGMHDIDVDDLGAMWTVFTKCKAFLENGHRLENMSWRLWHHEKQHSASMDYFSYNGPVSQPTSSPESTVSSSSSSSCSTASLSLKRFISSLDHSAWSHPASKDSDTSPTVSHDDANRQTWQSQDQETNHSVSADTADAYTDKMEKKAQDPQPGARIQHHLGDDANGDVNNESYYDDEDEDDSLVDQDDGSEFDDDDDDLFDEEDDDDDEEEEDDDQFEFYFLKKQPQPPRPQPSLLSALIQRHSDSLTQSSISSSETRHSSTPQPTSQSSAAGLVTQTAPREHFLRQELSESMRRVILWEHIQQQNLVHRKQIMYRQQPPCSEKPAKEFVASCWLESFRGW